MAPLVGGDLIWSTARHDVAAEVLRSDAFTVGNRHLNGPRLLAVLRRLGRSGAPVGPADPPSMLAVDPPEHTRYRRLVAKVFTRRAIEALRPRIAEHCAQLLDRMSGTVDLASRYAYELPLTVIAEILGIPADMRRQFLAWGLAMTPILDLGLSLGTYHRAERAIRDSNTWMLTHFERLRRQPGDDLLSQLVHLEDDAHGGRLTDLELLATAGLVLSAGFETTANMLCTGTELLIRNPEQLDLLRADPGLWPNAVEEILRYDTPVQNTSRVSSGPVELAGVRVPAGTTVVVMLGGANRDPAVFAEPDRFDVTRSNAREHLSFSIGRHHCLGAALARVEGQVALQALFDRFPDIALAGEPRRRATRVLRAYDALPVALRTIRPGSASADRPARTRPTTAPPATETVPPAPVLFASPAHPGQINPLLALAGELSRRGTPGLWFASEEGAKAAVEAVASNSPVRFLSTGATQLQVDDALYAAMTSGPRTTDGIVALGRVVRDPAITEQVFHATVEQVERIRPGLMVIDVLNVGALDAALATETPFVVSVPFPISGAYLSRLPWGYPTPTSGLPRRLGVAGKLANLAFRTRLQGALAMALVPRLARQRRAKGLANPLADPERYCAAARAVLAYSVFGLEYPFPVPPHVHLVGALVGGGADSAADPQRPRDELMGWLDQHESVVYVGLGTIARLTAAQLRALLEAFTGLGPRHHVLWKLSDDQRALLPETLPPHIRVENWIPSQLEVLAHPHTRAFVSHGGANGFHEGVYFGQPMLLLPFWLDCYDIAVRGVDAGVGLTLDRPPRIEADEVAAKLHRLLTDGTFRERSRYWGERLRQAGGVTRAADLVTRLATAG